MSCRGDALMSPCIRAFPDTVEMNMTTMVVSDEMVLCKLYLMCVSCRAVQHFQHSEEHGR